MEKRKNHIVVGTKNKEKKEEKSETMKEKRENKWRISLIKSKRKEITEL